MLGALKGLTYCTNSLSLNVWATDLSDRFQDHDIDWHALDFMMNATQPNPLPVAGNAVKLGWKDGQPCLTVTRRYIGSSVGWRFHLQGQGTHGQLDRVDFDVVESSSDTDDEDDENDRGGRGGRGQGRGRGRGGSGGGGRVRGGRAAPKPAAKAKAKPKAKAKSDPSKKRRVVET